MALPESYTIGVIYKRDTVYLYDAQPERMSYIVLLQNVCKVHKIKDGNVDITCSENYRIENDGDVTLMFERFKDTDYIELNLVRRQGTNNLYKEEEKKISGSAAIVERGAAVAMGRGVIGSKGRGVAATRERGASALRGRGASDLRWRGPSGLRGRGASGLRGRGAPMS
ncbi:hypothetical protein JCGZ_03928 [Jatropha curcas]|uniref:Uncharacterized protein n=1 Tax=Jatropha curcas TaxID=180498 RepID=A0A067KUJ4_JATCU|nr:hypothetical protein JCGZ_03928 [Jatropha curcas]